MGFGSILGSGYTSVHQYYNIYPPGIGRSWMVLPHVVKTANRGRKEVRAEIARSEKAQLDKNSTRVGTHLREKKKKADKSSGANFSSHV